MKAWFDLSSHRTPIIRHCRRLNCGSYLEGGRRAIAGIGSQPAEFWTATVPLGGGDGAVLRFEEVTRFQARLPRRFIASVAVCVGLLILACSAPATLSVPLPTEQPTPGTTPTAAPAQAGRAVSTPTGLITVVAQQPVRLDRLFIRLTDPLDEPEYYCLDVPGAGASVNLQSALQVHTCKARATAADELFTLDHP